MEPTTVLPDPERALSSEIVFTRDPADHGWYVGSMEGTSIYMRLGDFPDENLYSVWLGEGKWLELETLPSTWRIDYDQVTDWPESARPRQPKKSYI